MTVLALWSPVDLMLGVVGPLGAATAAGTALLVDLDPDGPHYGGKHSLKDLVTNGPTREQLEPTRSGPAVLRNGGVSPEDAEEVVTALVERWPNVVLRCAPTQGVNTGAVALLPLLPAPFTPSVDGAAVYQQTPLSSGRPRNMHVLPVPRSETVKALLSGVRPRSRDRWIRSFARVWEL
ncbi:hypothetical protein LCGC14_3001560 [marine sediment metagenome]|uniref:Uncharacterized protein n=1 Tax=marine sediment metagenome TaxID=412755 RepID=A0A0F8ZS01_9ZZZZ